MCDQERQLSRRDFVRLGIGALGGAALAGCGGRQLVRLTATPPTPQATPPTSTPPAEPSPTSTAAPTATLRPSPASAPTATTGPLPTAPLGAAAPPGATADTILINGKVATMNAADATAQAVAIKDGLILQVGTNDQIRALAGHSTRSIDLRGRTVTPGLIDSHNHLTTLGFVGTAYIDINPPAVRTLADLQKKIAEGVTRTPPGKWVVAQGFISIDGRQPDKGDIDPVSPNHPVMLINQGGHVGAVNSYALKLAGVTASTPNPPYGLLIRDQRGEPTGGLINHAAMDIFRRFWADDILTPAIRVVACTVPQAKFAAVGITTFGDVNVRGLESVKTYCDVARGGKMTIRGYIMNTIEYYKELQGRPEAIKPLLYEDTYLRFKGYKFLVDGAAGFAPYTHEPHTGLAWDMATWDPRALNDAVATLHGLGYQCAFHVIGDAAVDMALDAIEGAMKAKPRGDPRHRLEHAVFNTDKALKRTKDLGVVISTQPQGVRLLGDQYIKIMDEKRAARMIPTRTWLDMGIPLALGSDSPTTPWYQPQITLAGALSRLTATNKVLGPEQIITIKEAMRAHTMGSAYATFEEKLKGSLEPGKMADLIVWTEDPYGLPWQQLYQTTIDLTMVGGKTAYQKA